MPDTSRSRYFEVRASRRASLSREMLAFGGKVRFGMMRRVEYRLKLWGRLGRRMDKRGVCPASRHSKYRLNNIQSCIAHR